MLILDISNLIIVYRRKIEILNSIFEPWPNFMTHTSSFKDVTLGKIKNFKSKINQETFQRLWPHIFYNMSDDCKESSFKHEMIWIEIW